MIRVAKVCSISPPAVSQCLRNEEAQPGHTLLKGENHRITPIKAERIHLKRTRRILKIQEDTMDKLNVIPQRHHSVRIATVPMLYEKVASVIILKLSTRLSGTGFQLLRVDSGASVAYLLNSLADFVLICSPPLNHTLLTEDVLGEDQLLLVVLRTYLCSQLTREPTIGDHNLLSFIPLKSGIYTRGIKDKILAKYRTSLSRICGVDDHIMAKNFLEEGRDATSLPSPMIPDHAERHFFILPLKPSKTLNLILAYPNHTRPDRGKRGAPEMIWKVFNIRCF